MSKHQRATSNRFTEYLKMQVTRTQMLKAAGVGLAAAIQIAGYMTAAREFAELGQPLLVKYAYQLGGDAGNRADRGGSRRRTSQLYPVR